jgi:hypothetical protein
MAVTFFQYRYLLKLLQSRKLVDPDQNIHVDADPDRIRIDIKTLPILVRILPLVWRMLENYNIFFYSQHCQIRYNVNLFHQFQFLNVP